MDLKEKMAIGHVRRIALYVSARIHYNNIFDWILIGFVKMQQELP